LDKLDVKIIREFTQGDPHLASLSDRPTSQPAVKLLSKRLGISESAVRKRYQRLAGAVRGTFVPNPALIGERWGILIFDVPKEMPKEKILDQLKLIDGMVVIVNYVGTQLVCVFLYSDELSLRRKTDLIASISGCGDNRTISDFLFPPCKFEPSKTDLQIILSRLEDANRSFHEIATELGISSRTVKRRWTKMLLTGAVIAASSLKVAEFKDCVYCDLDVTFRNVKTRGSIESKILSLVEDELVYFGHHERITEFNLILSNIPMAEEILSEVRRIAGVSSARIDFVEERIELYGTNVEKVRQRVAAMN